MNGTSNTTPIPQELPIEALDLAKKLFDLARKGDTETLLAYLSAGIPANMRNSTGDSFIMLASYYNHPDLVEKLLERGGDPNMLNDKGQSPLAGAVFKGYTEVIKVLVEKGNADPRTGRPSALESAAMFKRWDCAEIMGIEEECRNLAPILNPVGSRD
jgi:ankyrin repeat protein